MEDQKMKNSKKTISKYGVYTIVLSLLILLALIAINLLVSLLPSGVRRIDATGLGLSELSDVSVDYLKSLNTDVTIAHICIYGKEEDTVTDLIEKYGEISDKIRTVQVDPAVDPSFAAKYTDINLDNNSVIVVSEKRAKVIEYNDLFTFALYYADSSGNYIPQGEMNYSDFTEFYNYYSSYFGTYYSYDTLFSGENAITSAIDYVVSDSLPTYYTLTGHGEAALPDSLIKDIELDNVGISELSLISSSVPDDASGIIIYDPYTDISDQECTKIRNYLSGGGTLILLTDTEYLDLPNIMSLAADYGLEAEQTYLCETTKYIGQIYMIVADSSDASTALGISGYSVVLPLAHPIKINEDAQTSALAYLEFFKTSENAYTVEEFSDGENDGYDRSDAGTRDIGVLATAETDGNVSHFLWISSPGYLSEEINSYSVGGNYVYFLAMLEQLTGKINSLAPISKIMVEPSLIMNSAQTYFWTVFLCVALPSAFIIAGAIVIRKRRQR